MNIDPEKWLAGWQGLSLEEREAIITAWWRGSRAICPVCHSLDIGLYGAGIQGDSPGWNRTDADLTDNAECHGCEWETSRSLFAAEQEMLITKATGGRLSAAQKEHNGYILQHREHRRAVIAELRAELERLSKGDPYYE